MIFIFGSARSGSTWLGKIFDSHPDVLYIHEPDIVIRGQDLLPHWFDTTPTIRDIENAGKYLRQLSANRHPRAMGIRPFFPKSYRGPIAEASRRSIIYVAKGLERLATWQFANGAQIPDLANPRVPKKIVMKSVSALGRAEPLIAAAKGDLRPILLLRHPCGYVASMLRGMLTGEMNREPGLGKLLDTRSAKRLGATPAGLANVDYVAQLSWSWLIANAEAYAAIEAAGGHIVVYDELARNAVKNVKTMFAQVGLEWAKQTEQFLHESAAREGSYYSVFRDPVKAVDGWREQLDADTVNRIRSIVSLDSIGRRFSFEA